MKKYSRILIIVNLLLLLGYFNWSIYQKEQLLKDGQFVLLQLAPVDPRSLMQGDYMSLAYAEGQNNTATNNYATPSRGYAILALDSNQVGKVVRLQTSLAPIHNGEIAIKYKTSNYGQLVFGAESYFFEEGQGDLYSNAAYGGLKVDKKGESVLIGLYDENHQLIWGKE